MNKYIVQVISPIDSSKKQEIEINDCYLFPNKQYYEFINDDNETIACFPIDMTIVLRVKKEL